MGLGKTIQTLSLLIHDQEQGRLDVPALVVCPTSVVSNWQREAERFAPRLRCLAHQGPNRLRGEEFVREAERTGPRRHQLRTLAAGRPTAWECAVARRRSG